MDFESICVFYYPHHCRVIMEAHSCADYLAKKTGNSLVLLHLVASVVQDLAQEFLLELSSTLTGSKIFLANEMKFMRHREKYQCICLRSK